MYLRSLQGYEKALGAEHTWTLSTVHNLGALYADQGKTAECGGGGGVPAGAARVPDIRERE
jgi:hypothetical protein